MQITTYAQNTAETIYVAPARNECDLIERIREASSSYQETRAFVLKLYTMKERPVKLGVALYALARARHREGRALSLNDLASLMQSNVKSALAHLKFLGHDYSTVGVNDTVIANDLASRAMCRVMED